MRQNLRAEHWVEFDRLRQGRPWEDVPFLPWAFLVSADQANRLRTATEKLHSELLACGQAILRAGKGSEWLPALPGLERSVLSDEPWSSPDFHWRYDFLWDRTSGRLSFIEVNAGDPSGLGWIASFTRTMMSRSFWRDVWGAEVTEFPLFENHQKALLSRLPQGSNPVLRLLSAEGSTVASDLECLAELYREACWDAQTAEPRELEIGTDGVFIGGSRVDVLLRDTYEELYWPPYEKIGPRLEELVREGRVVLLNPLGASFWDSKELWTLLPCGVEAAETRKLEEWALSPAEDYTEWVLKPAYDYGGRGVVCGFHSSPEVWARAINAARDSDKRWVVQRAARSAQEWVPSLSDQGDVEWVSRFVTWSAFVNNGTFSGLIARSSRSPVVNVHNGGAIFPVLISG